MKENVKILFGQKLSKLIEARGLTRAEFARKIGHERSLVSMWCNGKSYPKFQIMKKIADVFEISYEELVKIDEEHLAIEEKIKVLEDWIAENKDFEQKFNLEEIVDGTEGKKRTEYVEDLILEYRKMKLKWQAAEQVHRYDTEMIDRVKGESVELSKELRKVKEMLFISIADRVNEAFKQKEQNEEDLEALYDGCQLETMALKRQLKIKDKYLENMWFIASDYDGYETPESLKSLIDELMTMCRRASKNDDKWAAFQGGNGKYFNILYEEVPAPKEEE